MADIIAVHVPHQLLSEAVQKAEFERGRDWAYNTGFSIRTWPMEITRLVRPKEPVDMRCCNGDG